MKLHLVKGRVIAVILFVVLLAAVSMAGGNEELKIAQFENRIQELELKVKKLSSDTNQLTIRMKELEKKIAMRSN